MTRLWLLKAVPGDPLWEPWYDKMTGVVVRASTELAARDLAASVAGDEGTLAWRAPHSTCEPLENPGKPTVILRDVSWA